MDGMFRDLNRYSENRLKADGHQILLSNRSSHEIRPYRISKRSGKGTLNVLLGYQYAERGCRGIGSPLFLDSAFNPVMNDVFDQSHEDRRVGFHSSEPIFIEIAWII